ncbi:3-beta-hydroxysteroid-Delta(8) [Escovopsis weberi]|uniref:3-beta-hydroxysteroid-Delta(8) n=1 Tax=Escovopsis weberi TaxID=150374 RepID=A0A0M8MUI2_ESCWE|nr:3-beta-hydroxysteroid-Delta(8) [Escovopsis weberi]
MFFCQLMKVYALSDTRYILSDPFVVSIEAITVVVWGSLSVITVFAIIARSPARHMLQVIICVAHIYGLTLYFVTHLAEKHLRGIEYYRPEAFYYWAYCVGANLPWYFAPIYLMKDSYDEMVKAFKALEDKERKNV